MIRTQPRPPGAGPHVPDPNNCPFPQGFLATLHFLDNQRKCEAAHTSLPVNPSKVRHSDIYLAPGGVHGTKTKTS